MADYGFKDHLWQQRRSNVRGRTESVAGRLLAASSAVGGQSCARQRTLTRRQSATECQKPDYYHVGSILSRMASPFVRAYKIFVEELKSISGPAKAGLACALCSIICYLPGPLSFLNKNGMWAVITVDVCLGANVGLTLFKGTNRALGTLAASALAFAVDYFSPIFGAYQPAYLVFWAFVGAAGPTMFKFRRNFKDRWNYAVAMSSITFHILILSTSGYEDKIKLPGIRTITIVIGFCTACLVNLFVFPVYAGDVVNELVGKNLALVGNVMERCVEAYCDGDVLEQLPDIRAGKSEDDNIHTSFHEIVAADGEVARQMQAVPYEPWSHGKIFRGYPWHIYSSIAETLRDTIYDVASLDSCLRAEIQAPLHIRSLFAKDFRTISKNCAEVFRLMGESIREMQHVHCLHSVQQAEEGVLVLQYNIAKYFSDLNKIQSMESFSQAHDAYEESIRSSFQDHFDDELFASPKSYFGSSLMPHGEHSGGDKFKKLQHMADEHQDLLQRQESMGRQWNTTIQRISVFSLIKFASILIELVAKAKYVVGMVDQLEIEARFAEDEGNVARNAPMTQKDDG